MMDQLPHEQAYANHDQRINDLEALNSNLKSKLAKLMEKSQSKLSSLQKENTDLQLKLDLLLKSSTNRRTSNANDAANQLVIEKLNAKIALLESNVADLQNAAQDSGKSLADVNAQFISAKALLEATSLERDAAASEVEHLNSQLTTANDKHAALVNDLQSDLSSKVSANHTLVESVHNLNLWIAQAADSPHYLPDPTLILPPNSELNDLLTNLSAFITGRSQSVDELKAKLSEYHSKISEYEQTVMKLGSQVEQEKSDHMQSMDELVIKHADELANLRKEMTTGDISDHLTTHMNDLEAKLTTELAAHRQTNADLVAVQVALKKLESDHAQTAAANSDLKSKAADLTGQCQTLQSKLEIAQSKVSEITSKLDFETDRFVAKLEEMKANHQSELSEMQRLHSQSAAEHELAYKDKLAQLGADHNSQLETLRSEHAAALESKQDQLRKVHATEEEALTKKLAETKEKYTRDHVKLVADHKEAVSKLKSEHAAQIAKKQAEIKQLKTESSTAQSQLADEQRISKDARDKLVMLDADHARKEKEWREKQEEQGERLRIMDVQMRALAEESKEFSLVRSKVVDLQAELAAANKRNEELGQLQELLDTEKEQVTKLQKRNGTLSVKVEQLESEVQTAQVKIVELQEVQHQVVVLEKKQSALQAELDSRLQEYESMRVRAVAAESARDNDRLDWEKQIAQAIQECETIRSKHGADQASMAAQAQMYDEKQAEWALATSALQAQYEAQVAETAAKATDLTAVRMELGTFKSQVDVLTDEVRGLQAVAAQAQAQGDRIDELVTCNQRLAQDLEALSTREAHLKQVNRSLKDEVRKLSRLGGSGGLSIHTAKSTSSASSPPNSNSSLYLPAASGSSILSGAEYTSPGDATKLVNLAYLRSVLISFLEKKAMRAHLVPVLNTLLDGGDDDLKRLQDAIALPTPT